MNEVDTLYLGANVPDVVYLGSKQVWPDSTGYYIHLSQYSWSLSSPISATTSIIVETNLSSWDVSVNSSYSWITATKTSNTSAQISVTANAGSSSRYGVVNFVSNGTTYASLEIYQTGTTVITISISPTSINCAAGSQTCAVTVTSSVSGWEVSSSDNWLTPTKTSTSSAQISIDENTSSTRSGHVYFTYCGTTYATLNVSQASPVVITIVPTEMNFEHTGGTNLVVVTSNVTGWSVSSSSSWLTATKINEEYASIEVPSNTSSIRQGEVYFTYGGTTYATLSVLQKSTPVIHISISPDFIDCDASRQTHTITVTSSVTGWTVSSNLSWLRATKTNEIMASVLVGSNTTGRERSGDIYFKYNDITCATLTVEQSYE